MTFAGDKKFGKSLLWRPEDRFKTWLLPKVPKRIEGYHLTLTTVAWSTLVVVFSFLAQYNTHWLWLASVMIVFQYITDLLDGAIGRNRDTGLVKWGYYMDHFLDYLFLCSILVGYSFLVEDHYKFMLFFIISLFGAFMVNSFLAFAATNKFRISYLGIGPTEIRILFIIINTMLIFQRPLFVRALPYVLWFSTFGLFITVYRTSKEIWDIDMKTKYGDSYSQDSPSLLKDHEWTLGLSKRNILKHMGLSWLLAFAALSILMIRMFAPHHRLVAGTVYGISWIPLIYSFKEKRALLRQRGQQLKGIIRPYLPHIAMALLLCCVGYAANVLTPLEAAIPAGDIAKAVQEDRNSLHILNSNMDSLLDWLDQESLFRKPFDTLTPEEKMTVRNSWEQFLATSMELDLVKNKYKGFHKVDKLKNPTGHADSFFIAYSALVSQLKSSLRLMKLVGDNTFLETMLNESDNVRSIPANSYHDMKQRVTHPDELLRLNAGRVYMELVKSRTSFDETFVSNAETDVKIIYSAIMKDPTMLIANPRDIFEKTAFKAWFPLQKEIAERMNLIRTKKRKNFISEEILAEHESKLEPGDIILERRNWYMSNVGIPGFWPHVALYIGTIPKLNSYFKDVPGLDGANAANYIRNKYPAVFRHFESLDENGHDKCIIESLRPGSIFTSLEFSGTADYLGVIRPRMDREDKFKVILEAFSHFNKPYDYNFDFATDNTLVCSELVYKSYLVSDKLTIKPTLLHGRFLVSPNSIAEKFDSEYGTDKQQLDFVLFLDGNEETEKAVSRGVKEFRSSVKRPKWDILQE